MSTAVRRSLIAALLGIVALAVYGLTRLPGSASPPVSGIVEVSPEANDQIPQQGQVKINLQAGWAASLKIGQVPIPENQLTRDPRNPAASHRQLIFQPGPRKVFEAFPPGQNCATLTYWELRTGPQQSFTKTWCFTVI